MKTAVITGGTKGIGRALVEKFAKEGFAIFTCARNKQELDILYKELHSKYPHQVFHCLEADLSKKKML
jgi:short-subunit dehydrogenase